MDSLFCLLQKQAAFVKKILSAALSTQSDKCLHKKHYICPNPLMR